MSSPKKKAPDVIEAGGKKYKLTAFRIIADHECGTPEEVRLIRDGDMAEVHAGDRFMTAYVPVVLFKGASAIP